MQWSAFAKQMLMKPVRRLASGRARPPDAPLTVLPPSAAEPMRSVPVAVTSLTALLNRQPNARLVFKHLALVETACNSRRPDPLASLPPRVLAVAIEQLDALTPVHGPLATLRLQLERRLQEHRARVQAVLAAEERKWHVDTLPSEMLSQFPEAAAAEFEETLPLYA